VSTIAKRCPGRTARQQHHCSYCYCVQLVTQYKCSCLYRTAPVSEVWYFTDFIYKKNAAHVQRHVSQDILLSKLNNNVDTTRISTGLYY
jgi:hypothetical protein